MTYKAGFIYLNELIFECLLAWLKNLRNSGINRYIDLSEDGHLFMIIYEFPYFLHESVPWIFSLDDGWLNVVTFTGNHKKQMIHIHTEQTKIALHRHPKK